MTLRGVETDSLAFGATRDELVTFKSVEKDERRSEVFLELSKHKKVDWLRSWDSREWVM
jgi:hypothetical protein